MPLNFKALMVASLVKIALLGVAPTYAAGSIGHGKQSVDHSAAASSHGAAAVASGVATAVAVPMVGLGSAAMGSGAALQTAGSATIRAGGELIEHANGPLSFDADELRLDHQGDPAPRLN